MSKFIAAEYDEGASEVNAPRASFGEKLPAFYVRGFTERSLLDVLPYVSPPVLTSRRGAHTAMLRAMTPLSTELVSQHVRAALAEDIGSGDVTTLATVPENATARAAMVAREE